MEWIIIGFLILFAPIFIYAILKGAWIAINFWVDMIFMPFEFFYTKINNYLKQKELENDSHYIEGINDAVWWEEDDD